MWGGWVSIPENPQITIRCYRGRVVGVFLDGASLGGAVAPLLRLGQIRALAVRNNSLSGALPTLDNATASPWLRHLLVSRNQLTGSLNISLGALVTLRAEHNSFRVASRRCALRCSGASTCRGTG